MSTSYTVKTSLPDQHEPLPKQYEGRVGSAVECTVCGRRKAPRGRSTPALYLCDWECEGWHLDPFPGDLWPGETAERFGYPCQGAAEHWPDGTGRKAT